MDMLETCAKLFEAAGIHAAIFDRTMKLKHNTTSVPPELLQARCFGSTNREPVELPPKNYLITDHDSGLAAEVMPIYDRGELFGCVVRFTGRRRIAELHYRSMDRSSNRLRDSDIRDALTDMFLSQDALLLRHDQRDLMDEISEMIEPTVCRLLSGTVNSGELIHYFNGESDYYFNDISIRLNMTLDWASELFGKNGCTVLRDIDEDVCSNIRFPRLEAVLLNLMINSYMYSSSKKKEISVSFKNDKGDLYLTVSDRGTGADLSELRAAAEGRLGHREGSREGLGLMLARLFAERYEGELTFTQDENGLHTRISIPRSRYKQPIEFHMRPSPMLFRPYCFQQCILGKGLEIVR
ncbi:MAG: ATP-binding protein [Ruminococcus sp.]|nr:ATP-binding protein [Ruminococcus sp.]